MIKVIAIGNRLMQDDGAAVTVLECIRDRLETTGLDVIIGETDFQFYFHFLKEEDIVILLDAAYTDAEPGSVHVHRLQDVAPGFGETVFSHDMSFFELMRLYGKPLLGYMIGIEIAEVGYGCELSQTLKSKFNSICLEVERKICEIVKAHKINSN